STNLGEFNVDSGLNKINFYPSVKITKGSILLLTQNTAKLAIDHSSQLMFSDYFRHNFRLYKLNHTKNMALYLKTNVNQNFHTNFYSYEKKFHHLGIHNATATLSGLVATSVFNITNENFIDLICWNNNKTLDMTVNCSLYLQSQSSDYLIKIEYATQTIYETASSGNRHQKLQIPPVVQNPSTIVDAKVYYLLSTEFRMSTQLIGFEFYASQAGSISIKLESFASLISHSSYSIAVPVVYTHNSWNYQVPMGYNKIFLLESVQVKKGWFISLDMTSNTARIEVNPNASLFSDYYLE
ncbi:hypothetical protein BpHYR1_048232, partial [Brachionus plicatilis]